MPHRSKRPSACRRPSRGSAITLRIQASSMPGCFWRTVSRKWAVVFTQPAPAQSNLARSERGHRSSGLFSSPSPLAQLASRPSQQYSSTNGGPCIFPLVLPRRLRRIRPPPQPAHQHPPTKTTPNRPADPPKGLARRDYGNQKARSVSIVQMITRPLPPQIVGPIMA
jgi:hypothetical protein